MDILDIMSREPLADVPDESVHKLDLFKDYLSSIQFTKKDIWEENQASRYSPYVVNMMLGRDIGTVLYANEMNRLFSDFPKEAHYKWLIYSIPKGRRKMSGNKKDKKREASIQLVMEYFTYSRKKAMEALLILTDDNLTEIGQYLDKGGK